MKKYSTSVSKLIKRQDLYDFLRLDKNNKKQILAKFGFDLSTINFKESEITLRISDDEEFVKLTPTVNISYYDECDKLTKKVIKTPNNDDLVFFEGEIYEELNFNSLEEAKEFSDIYGYGNYVDQETKALIHFKGLEWNNNKIQNAGNIKRATIENNGNLSENDLNILRTILAKALEQKEIYIVKSKNYYTVYYNGFPISKTNDINKGFSISEIDNIINYLEHEVSDKGYFSLYARDAVNILKSNLSKRGYNPSRKFISEKSQQTYIDSLTSSDDEMNDNVFVKIKVVSNQPVVLFDSITKSFDKSSEIDKKYYVRM